MIEVKLVDPLEKFDEAIELYKANWKDSGNPFDVNVDDTKAYYKYMAENNALFGAAAYDDEKMIGYCIVTISPHPLNFSVKILNVDGLYLLPEHRGRLVLDKIRAIVKTLAEDNKVNFIHWHAPAESDFSGALAARYEPISNYYRETIIPTMSSESVAKAKEVEEKLLSLPQLPLTTDHVLHSGVYSRTVFIPKDVVISGALVKRSVNLIISGHVLVYLGDNKGVEYSGHVILQAMAHRKQVFIAKEDTYLTMYFATEATTIEQAESEFTDEVDLLMSRKPEGVNNVVITGV